MLRVISELGRVRWLVALTLLASCYSPSLRDCEVTCSGGVCPAGFRCVDQVCRVEGAGGPCGSTMTDDAAVTDDAFDAPADSGGPDTGCSHTCYSTAGTTGSMRGSTGCVTDNGCFAAEGLETVDFCRCTVGYPELYVQHTAGTTSANLAYVGSTQNGSTYSLKTNGGFCEAGVNACNATATAGCSTPSVVSAWTSVAVTPGTTHTFEIFGSSQCPGAPIATFTAEL